MDSNKLITLIDIAVVEVEKYIRKYNLPEENHLIAHTLKILFLLKKELSQNKVTINERVLRGFKDICTTTAIQYEDTNFNDPIFDVNNALDEFIPNYTQLSLLRMDFGKGDPI